MAEARIFYSGVADHALRLSEGDNSFGSSFESDVVLFEDDVQETHFTIKIESDVALLQVEPGATLVLCDAQGEEVLFDPALPFALLGEHSVAIGKAEIRLTDLPSGEEVLSSSDVAGARTRRGRFLGFSASSVVLSTICLTAGLFSTALATINDQAPGLEQMGDVVADTPALTADEIRKTFLSAGYRVEAVRPTDAGFRVTVYLPDETEGSRLRTFLDVFDAPVEAEIFVDTSLANATKLALSLADKEVAGVEVTAGSLVIEGAPADPLWRTDVTDMLRSDIPGLRSISFSGRSEAWRGMIEEDLVAVWAGTNPYIVLSDGRKIREGQKIADAAIFNGVDGSETLKILVNGNQEEYRLK